MDSSINAPLGVANKNQRVVWFEGSTALAEGQAVCYNYDYGTASAETPARYNRVELPSTSNNMHFAGVADKAYTAVTGGQLIKINLPGSCCNILSYASTTLGSGRLTFECGGTYAGYFRDEGFSGAGSAKPLQTVDRSSTAGTCLAILEEGPQSWGCERLTALDNAAVTPMVGGATHMPAVTLTNGDCTATLADGVETGLRKAFYLVGAMTTNNFVLTVTSGMQADGSTALATWTADEAADELVLQWNGIGAGGVWTELAEVGGTKA